VTTPQVISVPPLRTTTRRIAELVCLQSKRFSHSPPQTDTTAVDLNARLLTPYRRIDSPKQNLSKTISSVLPTAVTSNGERTLQISFLEYTLYSIFEYLSTTKRDREVVTEETDEEHYETLSERDKAV
jgi:hypothetical protein